ncbi:serine/threonine protein phosphatase PP2A-associated protein [Ephemerocybe angulata]|uniref:Serine/threonine protein phosphatase PP2A-associated protein n=1 Tax=Ephemerocybe angulata TaxID=980116 RepID=A0A8H6IF74_9AGAR|nr:serine/threonine protein phosphatase PP2A-associated protein [Tulosesus angulatus]
MSDNVSLPALYASALDGISKLINLPPSSEEKQQLVTQSLATLKTVHSRIVELSLFSPNETVEDIATRDLIYLSLPFVLAEVLGRVQNSGRSARLESIAQTQRYLKTFTYLLETYAIVPEVERELYEKQASAIRDPAKKRELKINQFKKERDLKNRIQTLRKRRSQEPVSDDLPSTFDLIASLLPAPSEGKETKESDTETDEILRETTLILLRLLYAQAQGQLEGLQQEEELLKMAPPSPEIRGGSLEQDERVRRREEEASMWRLDAPRPSGGPDGKGPLLDSSGRILRPFTILPSDAGERQRLQAEVFGPSHNLPTMSIDEYLQIEKDSGRIITGGGAASQNAPTTSEQLQLDSELDGTAFAEEREEQKRQKDEKWAIYTDENPRGAGNTMNRG